jgi:hypothetical protein
MTRVLEGRSPREIDDLVGAVAEALGISDPQPLSDDMESVAGDSQSPLSRAEESDSLRFLWRQIVELPPKQRIALLLSIRDETGNSPLTSLPLLAIASSGEIAAALESVHDHLINVWDRLPLHDSEIAAMLLVTQQQVINLRKAARDRLRRRFARSRYHATEH